VPQLVAYYRALADRAPAATDAAPAVPALPSPAEPDGLFAGPVLPPVGPLLWAASMTPAGGSLHVAEAEVAAAAADIDWDTWTRRATAERRSWDDAAALSRALLLPLTPSALAPVLSRGS